MNEKYKQELKDLRKRMKKAEEFAEKLPVFRNRILEEKLTGEGDINFGYRYKKIPLDWGIKRYIYNKGYKICNCNKDFSGALFNIYVNSVNLFNEHYNFDLYKSIPPELCFFVDRLNSTFYILDENIEPFLDALNDWYVSAMSRLDSIRKEKEISNLKKRLKELEDK